MSFLGLNWPMRRRGRAPALPPDERRLIVQLQHDSLVNDGLKLRNAAINRVVQETQDAVIALEVVAVATHTGKGGAIAMPRRAKDSNPLEALAIKMVETRLEADPMDDLDKMLDRRERLEDAADRMTGAGGRRRGAHESGNGIMDAVASIADTELGRALGAQLGMQMRMAMPGGSPVQAPAVERQPSPTPVLEMPAAASSPFGSEALEDGAAPEPAGLPTAPTMSLVPPPMSLQVSIALRMLRALKPPEAAKWIWDNAATNDLLGQIIDSFVATDPNMLIAFLEAVTTSAASDSAMCEWVPLIQELRDNPAYAMAVHTRLREIAADEEFADTAAGH